jgi:two-component system response regulator ChvI
MNGPKKHIALVDDEETLLSTLEYALTKEGYEVEKYPDGLAAWNEMNKQLPDLAILDIIMPQMDGLELCRRLRAKSPSMPIIFLTSKDEEFDRVLGLEIGADDYLCKPFSIRELLARVKVLFRRIELIKEKKSGEDEVLVCGDLSMDRNRMTITWKHNPVTLTVTEFRLLQSLIHIPGHVKTREQLLKEGYPEDIYLSDRTIDCHIKRLRKKIQQVDDDFNCIETVYGMGYRYRQNG